MSAHPNLSTFELVVARIMFKLDSKSRRCLWLKLAKLIGNGVEIRDALASIRDLRIKSGETSHRETIALGEWEEKMNNGRPLSEAMDTWIPTDERTLVAAGEASGTMEVALQSAARVLYARKQINDAVIEGLAYPVILLLTSFGVLYLVVPHP